MIRAVVLGVIVAASLAQLVQGAQAAPPQNPAYEQKILNNPTTGDDFAVRNAIHQMAQGRSDALFTSLSSLLGGTAPRINFVPAGSPFAPNHMATNLTDRPGAPVGTINIDPYATAQITNDAAPDHSGWVNQMPHEDAHTRQSPATLANLMTREGGAQAFADLVTQSAANAAKIPYTPGNFDGSYAPLVTQAQALGRPWVLAGQFGKSGSPTFP